MPVPRCKFHTPLGSPRTTMRSVSPRTRCEVQCVSHPTPDARSSAGPQTGKDLRVLPQTVFLDTASQRGMTRWRGPVRPQRERAEQTPPLSGREEANRPRKKGEDCLSTASSAAPEGGDSLRAKKPDNSGGASWFVLLAVEKNEHTGSPRTAMRGPVRGLLWVLPLPVFPARVFLDSASSAE